MFLYKNVLAGSYLFSKVTNRSYTFMFSINVSLLVLSIVYTLLRLKWRTGENQRPLSEASNVFRDFFDCDHVSQTFKYYFEAPFLFCNFYWESL